MAAEGMGLVGWLGRRVIAALIFGPLVAMWYVIFSLLSRALHRVPCAGNGATSALGACAEFALPIALLSVVAAFISDWLIIRRIKRAMTESNRPR